MNINYAPSTPYAHLFLVMSVIGIEEIVSLNNLFFLMSVSSSYKIEESINSSDVSTK